jgi:hypothetical protein
VPRRHLAWVPPAGLTAASGTLWLAPGGGTTKLAF